jgi:hypothetical protein
MPNMMVTPKMREAMGDVLVNTSLTPEEKGLLVQPEFFQMISGISDDMSAGKFRHHCQVISDASN